MTVREATTRKTRLIPAQVFAPVAGEYGAMWLDSSLHFGDRGRYSFIARNPSIDLRLDNGRTNMTQQGKETSIADDSRYFDLLERLLANRKLFAVGYITYEATLPFLGLTHKFDRLPVPSARFMFYDSVLRYDHRSSAYGVTDPQCDDYSDLLRSSLSASVPEHESAHPTVSTMQALSRQEYIDRVKQVKWHVREGDIYQVNFTTRFDVSSDADPFEVYTRLRELNPSPYSAYMNFGDYQVLSSSPERMLQKSGDFITTCPIKGTIARGNSRLEETENLKRLANSEKDRAELLMIVDLERNDLGKIARTGSVTVERLFATEIYSSLIHLVSDISARLKPATTMKEVLEAMLPGGSITGAPKKRAVEIINQLENRPRSIYTGCIGYMNDREADFSIAIRTMLRTDTTYYVHAGGGIVADSDPEAEYNEMLLKARNLFRSLGASVCPKHG